MSRLSQKSIQMKTFTELSKLKTFEERFLYLKLHGKVGEETFGLDRYLNQVLYRSEEWKRTRRLVIIRDEGRDLGIPGREIEGNGNLYIHHINPITLRDIQNRDPKLFDLENLITVSKSTHNAIHYGDENLLLMEVKERRPNDTCPWKQ